MATPSIIFMGTPDFAVASLRAIHAAFPVTAVVTAPDKARGRGKRILPTSVKRAAQDLGITTILQPERLKDEKFQQQIERLQPDIIAVVAFRILPSSIYSLARCGAFNIHGSLLPRYRGAAPINWAIIEGARETGVTSFLLADKVDTGAMLDQRRLTIPDGMTAGELHDALMPMAAELAADTCCRLLEGRVEARRQNDEEATRAPKIFRDDCRIDWNAAALQVRNLIHGVSPLPGAFTQFEGKSLKIYRARQAGDAEIGPGEFFIGNEGFLAGCADGALALEELQVQGKRRIVVAEFLRGYRGPHRGHFA